MIEFALDWILN